MIMVTGNPYITANAASVYLTVMCNNIEFAILKVINYDNFI